MTVREGIDLVPVLSERMADLETPVSAFAKLRPLGASFLFESVEGGERIGRYSFIGLRPRATIVVREGLATVTEGASARSRPAADPLSALRAELAAYRRPRTSGLPRFSGGAVGYVAYEAARWFERLPLARGDPYAVPDAHFAIHDVVVAFDHVRHTLTVLAHEERADEAHALDRIAAVFAALDASVRHAAPRPEATRVGESLTSTEFIERVGRARELVRAGDCIQIVLSRRFDVRPAPDPLSLYRALRHVNPSPYMFYLEAGDVTLVGSSPEPFVRVEGRRMIVHPIAGTRPRGADETEDAVQEAELRGSEKERAEHVMLVDLARNDIGRVARAGSVVVKELMRVDRFSHVMHLTSVVEGDLADGVDALGAFSAAFPAGTVSGAPKIRAMERIAELEPDRRGPYAGAVGYLGFDGDLDTCIAIRTAVIGGGTCRIQAGAGIVADSDPEAEEAEVRAKARALLRAVELAGGLETLA